MFQDKQVFSLMCLLFSGEGKILRARTYEHMDFNVRKHTFRHVRPAKILISLRIRAVWPESSLEAVSSCEQRRLWSDCADAHADLSLHLAHMSEGTFFFTWFTCRQTVICNTVQGDWIHLLGCPPLSKFRKLSWFSVCFPAHHENTPI